MTHAHQSPVHTHTRQRLAAIALATLIAPGLAGCVTGQNNPQPGDTILLIKVGATRLNNKDQMTGDPEYLLRARIRNLTTGEVFAIDHPSSGNPAILKVTPGDYCLQSFTPYANLNFDFCKAPAFRVKPNAINNAGEWKFGINYDNMTFKLLAAMSGQEELARQSASQKPALFQSGRE